MAIDFTCFRLAALSYAVYLAFVIAIRVGRHPAPFRRLCRIHFYFILLYGIGGAAYGAMTPGFHARVSDFAVGLYWFFALHYAFLLQVYGQATRGFSMNICVSVCLKGGTASVQDILRSYGAGKGADYVQADRIKVLKEHGAVSETNGKLRLTRFGLFAVRLNRFLLQVFGQDYLGRKKGHPA